MNKFIGIGRLTRDPELTYTQSNQAICTFTMAIDRPMSRDKREEAGANGRSTADFPRVNVWGEMAESCNQYLSKGSQCAVEGSIQTGSYKDKDGKTVYTTEILAQNVQFLSRDKNTQGNQNNGSKGQNRGNDDDFTEIEDDGRIPF